MDRTIIEALGLTQEELTDRVVARIADQILTESGQDEDGNETRFASTVHRQVTQRVMEATNAAVAKIGQEILAPGVEQMVRSIVLQKTNQWGESRGEPVTFVEYLTQRAHEYLREEVSHDGVSKAESRDGYSWRASTTRVTHLIEKYLKYEIETFAKQSLSAANGAIADGIAAAVKSTMKQLADGLTVTAVVPKR